MQTSSRGSGIFICAFLLLLLAATNGWVLYRLSRPDLAPLLVSVGEAVPGGAGAVFQQASATGLLPWIAVPLLGPLVVALLLLLVGRGRGAAPAAKADTAAGEGSAPPIVVEPSPGVGLRLLATLQEEARLVDFVREDIEGYSDAEVGSAVRGIHAALRKSIGERVVLEPILAGEDGDPVQVPADFEPALIRVTGKPSGDPPYHGVLRHGGWRARDVRLPAPSPGSDPSIIMPAEVEVGSE